MKSHSGLVSPYVDSQLAENDLLAVAHLLQVGTLSFSIVYKIAPVFFSCLACRHININSIWQSNELIWLRLRLLQFR